MTKTPAFCRRVRRHSNFRCPIRDRSAMRADTPITNDAACRGPPRWRRQSPRGATPPSARRTKHHVKLFELFLACGALQLDSRAIVVHRLVNDNIPIGLYTFSCYPAWDANRLRRPAAHPGPGAFNRRATISTAGPRESRRRIKFNWRLRRLLPEPVFPGSENGISSGRGSRIRTCDLLVPNQTRYQTALCPDGYRRSIHASIQAGKQAFNGR